MTNKDDPIEERVEAGVTAILSVPATVISYMNDPDPIPCERACLFAMANSGEKVSLEELNHFLVKERRIAKFKLPERLEIVDQLPQTYVGKIKKRS